MATNSRKQVGFRPPEALKAELDAYSKETGHSKNTILVMALRVFLKEEQSKKVAARQNTA